MSDAGRLPRPESVVGLTGPLPLGEIRDLPLGGLDEEALAPDGISSARLRGRNRGFSAIVWLAASDLVALCASLGIGLFFLAFLSRAQRNSLDLWTTNTRADALLPFAILTAFATYGLYHHTARRVRPSAFSELRGLLHAVAAGGFLAEGVTLLGHRAWGWREMPAAQVAAVCGVALVLVPAARVMTRHFLPVLRRHRLRVLIVGSGMMAGRIANYLAADPGVEVIGQVDDDPMAGTSVIGKLADLPRLCKEENVDRVLVGFSATHPRHTTAVLRQLHREQVPISVVPRYFELLSWRSEVDEIRGLPIVDVAPPYLGWGARFAKRAFDIVFSATLLVLLAIPLAAMAVAVKATSAGPVLFSQERLGRNRKPFRIYKLRTMRVGAEAEKASLHGVNEADGPLFKLRRDPRITPVGGFLRRTSLDELPQLINVFLGQMSLVGPRPFVTEEANKITGWALRRFEVRPGITGLWQVSGRSDLSFDELCHLDYLYVASWSLWWDIKIAWQTPASVLRRDGAY